MKVYVIKRRDGWYYMDTYNGEVRFTTGLYKALLVKYKSDLEEVLRIHKEGRPKEFKHCEVVEVQIMETKDLSDYTKQVRKEVLGELMNMLGDRAELIDCGGVAEFMFTTYDLSMCVKEILGEEVKENEDA